MKHFLLRSSSALLVVAGCGDSAATRATPIQEDAGSNLPIDSSVAVDSSPDNPDDGAQANGDSGGTRTPDAGAFLDATPATDGGALADSGALPGPDGGGLVWCGTPLPDATNTGVPAGVTLTPQSGGLTVTTAGTVVDSLDVQGTLYIQASNVTVKRSRVTVAGTFQVRIDSGLTGVVVEDTEINGVGTGNDGCYGILGPGTFQRNNIYNVENGIVPDSGSVIEDNYIHDLLASGSPHYDGIQIDGGLSNITIKHNNVINAYDQTSAVMTDNYFGALDGVTIDCNRLVGGGYPVYCSAQFNSSAITNELITNNRIGTGAAGYFDFNSANPTESGNVDDVTGMPIQ